VGTHRVVGTRTHRPQHEASARSRISLKRRDATSASGQPRRAVDGGRAGRSLEDRTREQLYVLAEKRNIRGRSKMGKWDLIRALRA